MGKCGMILPAVLARWFSRKTDSLVPVHRNSLGKLFVNCEIADMNVNLIFASPTEIR